MCLSLVGIIGLALAPNFYFVLASVLFIGLGSAIFHPEGSRVAYMAAGQKRGLAQSIYQVGGNTGQSMAPLFTAFIFISLGQFGTMWFTILAAVGVATLYYVSTWYKQELIVRKQLQKKQSVNEMKVTKKLMFAIALLIFLVFARSWYGAGILNYFQFYLIEAYGVTIKHAQIYVFLFMIAGVFGTFFGGPLADRFGKRNVLLVSMLGSAPFALMLPHVTLGVAAPLLLLIGFILQSSFSVTVVYAQELLPGKIGLVSGLIVGLAFGMGALGAVIFGKLADIYSLQFIMLFCSILPLLGILTWLLPSDKEVKQMNSEV